MNSLKLTKNYIEKFYEKWSILESNTVIKEKKKINRVNIQILSIFSVRSKYEKNIFWIFLKGDNLPIFYGIDYFMPFYFKLSILNDIDRKFGQLKLNYENKNTKIYYQIKVYPY